MMKVTTSRARTSVQTHTRTKPTRLKKRTCFQQTRRASHVAVQSARALSAMKTISIVSITILVRRCAPIGVACCVREFSVLDKAIQRESRKCSLSPEERVFAEMRWFCVFATTSKQNTSMVYGTSLFNSHLLKTRAVFALCTKRTLTRLRLDRNHKQGVDKCRRRTSTSRPAR
jgi:hypothetical protein